jgi:hypothetical protein
MGISGSQKWGKRLIWFFWYCDSCGKSERHTRKRSAVCQKLGLKTFFQINSARIPGGTIREKKIFCLCFEYGLAQ